MIITGFNPFTWGAESVEKFAPFYEERKASYTDPAETVFEANQVETFRDGIEAATPPIAEVCGFECVE